MDSHAVWTFRPRNVCADDANTRVGTELGHQFFGRYFDRHGRLGESCSVLEAGSVQVAKVWLVSSTIENLCGYPGVGVPWSHGRKGHDETSGSADPKQFQLKLPDHEETSARYDRLVKLLQAICA